MSGETEDSVSGWTTDTLHAHIEGLIPLVRDINRGELAIRDERMSAMDKANMVLDRTITRVPTDLQVAVGNLDRATGLRMDAIEKVAELNAQQFIGKFAEFDARLIRDLAANSLQVAAAFAASEKLSIALDAANKEAISKSEVATASNVAALGATITDVKDRLTRLETSRTTVVEERNDRRLSNGAIGGFVSLGVGVLALILSIIVFIVANKP